MDHDHPATWEQIQRARERGQMEAALDPTPQFVLMAYQVYPNGTTADVFTQNQDEAAEVGRITGLGQPTDPQGWGIWEVDKLPNRRREDSDAWTDLVTEAADFMDPNADELTDPIGRMENWANAILELDHNCDGPDRRVEAKLAAAQLLQTRQVVQERIAELHELMENPPPEVAKTAHGHYVSMNRNIIKNLRALLDLHLPAGDPTDAMQLAVAAFQAGAMFWHESHSDQWTGWYSDDTNAALEAAVDWAETRLQNTRPTPPPQDGNHA